ncbi:MAG: hypothetical protein ABL940_10110 [Bacteroidia bacterium]
MQSFLQYIKRNAYRYFAYKLVVLLVVVVALDYGIGKALSYWYFKQTSGLQYRTTYSVDSTTANVLIVGSSRANHHYYPTVLEQGLQQSYYNMGRDGSFIFYHYAVLKAVLQRYSPKVVILDFNRNSFEQDINHYDRLSALLPYYATHPEMRPIIALKSQYERIKLLSHIYPYNSALFTIAVGNMAFNKKRKEDQQGYVPLTRVWNSALTTDSSAAMYAIDSVKIHLYQDFINQCTRDNVKLYVVCSPYFTQYTTTDYSLTIAKQLAAKHHVTFLDYSNDTTFTHNAKLFADVSHLNNEGAKLFSTKLMQDLKW